MSGKFVTFLCVRLTVLNKSIIHFILQGKTIKITAYPPERKWLVHKKSLKIPKGQSFPHSRLITGFVTRLTRRVSLVEQEPFTIPEHLRSPPVFSGVRVTRSDKKT
jgi:hypothetical protein